MAHRVVAPDDLHWITRPHASGEPARHVAELSKRLDVPTGGVVTVEPGTALQSANHGDVDLLVYAYGTPPESEHAELLDSAL